MPAIKSAPRSKVAPCTARLANQPSTQPTLSIVSAAMTVRSKVGILPHSQMLGICKTILRGAPGPQARDRAGTPDAGAWAERDLERRKGLRPALATFGGDRGPLGQGRCGLRRRCGLVRRSGSARCPLGPAARGAPATLAARLG